MPRESEGRPDEVSFHKAEKLTRHEYADKNNILLGQYRETESEDEKIKIRNEIAELNANLVHFVLWRYFSIRLDHQEREEDYYSEGYLGLIKAIESYDPAKGTKFSTWAIECIRLAIINSLRAKAKNITALSLDQPLAIKEEGSDVTLADTIPDKSPSIPETIIKLDPVRQKQLRSFIDKLFGDKPKQKEILLLYYNLGTDQSYGTGEISAKLKIPLRSVKALLFAAEKRLQQPDARTEIAKILG